METPSRCPRCARPLAAGVSLALCPECLLRAGLGTDPAVGTTAAPPFQPPAPAALAPLFPQLEILALIGQGGMGAVYRARQVPLQREVALKILSPAPGRDPGFAERFAREAQALARLNHPNIVGVHDFGQAGGYHYLVMEFVEGVTLRHLLVTGRTTPREALAIVPQICEALQFAHDRGIVHRDIKPENLLISREGTVKVADFGLAKLMGIDRPAGTITGEHDVMGTPHYMAPEQVEHPREVDHRADIYSLGVVFYQLLTGELPMGRFAPPSRRVRIDVRLDEVVLRALEKEPERRYQQASGLRVELETIASSPADGHVSTPEATGPAAAPPAAGESPTLRGWFLLAAVWVLAGLALWDHSRLIVRYLDTVGELGRRAADPAVPLQQMFPGFASDAQVWVRHALALQEGAGPQLRHTAIDNAPAGREVHWNSAWAWCIAGAGWIHRAVTGLPLPRATERATLWLTPVAMLACIVLLSTWAMRRLGLIAAVFVAVAFTCHDRIYEGFFPGYVDHHGLLAIAVAALVLGSVGMGGGWWHPAGGRAALPDSAASARRSAVFSALGGAAGLWIDAATSAPAIAIVGAAGLLTVALQGRAAAARGAGFAPEAWRAWARVGAGASALLYLLEFFPRYLGVQLDANHPFYAIAWLGVGELVARCGERRFASPAPREPWGRVLAWPVLAVAVVPLTLVVGRAAVLPSWDPFLAALQRGHVRESMSLWQTMAEFDLRAIAAAAQLGALPVLGALLTLAYFRQRTPPVLGFVTLVTAALTAMAWWQAQWLLNVVGASIALTLVLLACWTGAARPFVRWALALALLAQFFVPNAVLRRVEAARDLAHRRVSPGDAMNALYRDIAAALRSDDSTGDLVLLASPNASAGIGYHGRIRTLGTLQWENRDGLKAAAAIFAAGSDDAAREQLRRRRVTHIALVSPGNFVRAYHELLHPAATSAELRGSFGQRLLRGETAPSWLEPLPYSVPDDLKPLQAKVALYRVK